MQARCAMRSTKRSPACGEAASRVCCRWAPSRSRSSCSAGFCSSRRIFSGWATSGAARRRCPSTWPTTPRRPTAAARSKVCWRRAPSSPSVEFVSKAEALARFKQTFADLAPAVDSARRAIRCRRPTRSGFSRAGQKDAADGRAGGELRQTPGVADVRYDRQWLDRLAVGDQLIRGIGLAARRRPDASPPR